MTLGSCKEVRNCLKFCGPNWKLFGISNSMITINLAPLHENLTVRSFGSDHVHELSDIESRLMHLGFIHGETVKVKKKAPLFQQPFLVEVRGRLVALTESEASLVKVEVQK